jgi:dolichol-phosphate mannosyltransferase
MAAERTKLLRFAAVGLLGVVFQLAAFALLIGPAGVNHLVAAAVSTALALCSNFVLNRIWTFEAAHLHMGVQAAKFAIVSVVAIGVNVLVVLIVVDGLGAPKGLGEVLAVCFQAPVSYVGNRAWTFADAGPQPSVVKN